MSTCTKLLIEETCIYVVVCLAIIFLNQWQKNKIHKFYKSKMWDYKNGYDQGQYQLLMKLREKFQEKGIPIDINVEFPKAKNDDDFFRDIGVQKP